MMKIDEVCVCQDKSKRLNPEGYCELCLVLGCQSCATGDSSTCVSCDDGMTLNDGKCFCPEGDQRFNAEGECVDCFVDGCEVCDE